MAPPASADRFASDHLGNVRQWSTGRFQEHPVFDQRRHWIHALQLAVSGSPRPAIWDGGQRRARTIDVVRDLSAVGTWGSSAAERAAAYPCDGLIDRPDRVLFRAVDVAAPAGLVFRWLCQLRVAPYSYDWIDNLGRRSPRRLTEGLDDLEVGQRFMTIFRLASLEEGRSITLDTTTPLFGRVAVTYQVTPTATYRSRLVAKLAFVTPRGLHGGVMRLLLPTGDLIMMRKQMLTLRALAERDATRPNV
jgi:hypothetical protein